ncbi:efflux RND transporter periplasmic adaptor subunit [Azospira restricta]|uniref:Efflux RND transporter periplasmic adaptor subunit n=1 Tax=Azospira restricta TaxID=404405 RepID=A0A974PVA1_9RHOO|nr:efflux RND transporter periplasmic adaptor subunit [Azospira restricta]QRJ62130.1 efflux RND transporter periplasmic adaptor subunit [Azospira restricta]
MTTGNPSATHKGAGIALALLAAIAAAGGGYWLGSRGAQPVAGAPVAAAPPADGGKQERKLLYYRNPMGLPDTSPVPKKDPMGMDYIPVYAGEQDEDASLPGTLKLSTEKVQKLGVKSEAAQLRALGRSVRAVGRVEPDERRLYAISPKFEGYVERLHVNVTGQPVGKGQPLFEVYSPELVSAQREYAIAKEGIASLADAGGTAQAGMNQLAESAKARLRNWDISEEQLKALTASGEAKRTLTFRSPVAGIVTEKKAVQGMRFMPGEALYQIADLSSVWVIADVAEQDIGQVKTGAKASVRIDAYPDKTFEGRVAYVYPTLQAGTRTVPVRIELANPGLLLKPAMFAQVELRLGERAPALTVPASAVIDSGTRRVVLVRHGEGRFEPREVKTGARSDDYVEILDGVKDGEQVVVAANFLIDAESNLKAALGGLAAAPAAASTDAPAKAVGHQAEGSVDSLDAVAGTLMLQHGAVPSLKWPAMTMEFKAANPALLQGLKPGTAVAFEFVERQPGEWVVTKIAPKAAQEHKR